MKSAWSGDRKLPEAQLPTNVASPTGMWRVWLRCTSNPFRDWMAIKEVGGAELVTSHPGARTAYAVLTEAGTVFWRAEEEPGGTGGWKDTAGPDARKTTSGAVQ